MFDERLESRSEGNAFNSLYLATRSPSSKINITWTENPLFIEYIEAIVKHLSKCGNPKTRHILRVHNESAYGCTLQQEQTPTRGSLLVAT